SRRSVPISTPFPYTTLFRSAFAVGAVLFEPVLPVALLPLPLERLLSRHDVPVVVDVFGAVPRHDLPQLLHHLCERRPLVRVWCRSEEHTSELQSREKLVCRL